MPSLFYHAYKKVPDRNPDDIRREIFIKMPYGRERVVTKEEIQEVNSKYRSFFLYWIETIGRYFSRSGPDIDPLPTSLDSLREENNKDSRVSAAILAYDLNVVERLNNFNAKYERHINPTETDPLRKDIGENVPSLRKESDLCSTRAPQIPSSAKFINSSNKVETESNTNGINLETSVKLHESDGKTELRGLDIDIENGLENISLEDQFLNETSSQEFGITYSYKIPSVEYIPDIDTIKRPEIGLPNNDQASSTTSIVAAPHWSGKTTASISPTSKLPKTPTGIPTMSTYKVDDSTNCDSWHYSSNTDSSASRTHSGYSTTNERSKSKTKDDTHRNMTTAQRKNKRFLQSAPPPLKTQKAQLLGTSGTDSIPNEESQKHSVGEAMTGRMKTQCSKSSDAVGSSKNVLSKLPLASSVSTIPPSSKGFSQQASPQIYDYMNYPDLKLINVVNEGDLSDISEDRSSNNFIDLSIFGNVTKKQPNFQSSSSTSQNEVRSKPQAKHVSHQCFNRGTDMRKSNITDHNGFYNHDDDEDKDEDVVYFDLEDDSTGKLRIPTFASDHVGFLRRTSSTFSGGSAPRWPFSKNKKPHDKN
jgi:hypothetical protein